MLLGRANLFHLVGDTVNVYLFIINLNLFQNFANRNAGECSGGCYVPDGFGGCRYKSECLNYYSKILI